LPAADRRTAAQQSAEQIHQAAFFGAFGAKTVYEFPVPNGTYTVPLKFADPFLNDAGVRIFDVIINNAVLLPQFDTIRLRADRRKP
jgi:hypothetical protein